MKDKGGMMKAVELRNGLPDKDRRKVQAYLVLAAVIFAGVLLVPRYGAPAEWPWREMAEALLPPYEISIPSSRVTPAVCLVLCVYLSIIWKGARLVIGPEGISHDSGLPRWLKFLNPGWSYEWGEVILRPAVERITVPGQAWLVVDAGTKQHRLQMLGWHRMDGKRYESAAEIRQRALRLMSLERSTEAALERSALLNTLAEFDIPLLAAGRQKDALERVKGGMALAYITIGGVALGTVGMMMPFEKFVFGIPWPIVVTLGITAMVTTALAVARWMRALNVGEQLILPVLVGGAVAFASIPGLQILNAVTATAPMRTVAFEQQPDLTLVPVKVSDVPVLRFYQYPWYWAEFDAGHVHEIRVRKGGLGLWAYDYRDLTRQIRERDD